MAKQMLLNLKDLLGLIKNADVSNSVQSMLVFPHCVELPHGLQDVVTSLVGTGKLLYSMDAHKVRDAVLFQQQFQQQKHEAVRVLKAVVQAELHI